MRRLAAETGRAFFEVTKDDPIEEIYAQIEETLRNQYSLGYTPDRAGTGGEYRRIKLIVKQPGLVVHTRAGYYSR